MAFTGPNSGELLEQGQIRNIDIDNTEDDIAFTQQYIARNTASLEELRSKVTELRGELERVREELGVVLSEQRDLIGDRRNRTNVADDMEILSTRRSRALETMGTINGELRRLRRRIDGLETLNDRDIAHVDNLRRELITGELTGGKRKSHKKSRKSCKSHKKSRKSRK